MSLIHHHAPARPPRQSDSQTSVIDTADTAEQVRRVATFTLAGRFRLSSATSLSPLQFASSNSPGLIEVRERFVCHFHCTSQTLFLHFRSLPLFICTVLKMSLELGQMVSISKYRGTGPKQYRIKLAKYQSVD